MKYKNILICYCPRTLYLISWLNGECSRNVRDMGEILLSVYHQSCIR